MNLSRRGLLGGIIAACAAPAIVRSGLIMPIKPKLVVGLDLNEHTLELLIKQIRYTKEMNAFMILNTPTKLIVPKNMISLAQSLLAA